ncbi:MAG: class I SAM-dependent methyltransferase [Actinomycetota bacterium]|nr:class I SAM-dependent methyltransferase [Actinomycetota bacterium]
MSVSLPEMEGGWDELFDERYTLFYPPSFSEGRTGAEAEGAARLAEVPAGAEILDCPCGYARHALVLAEAGYRVTGADRSQVQLAEAERRRGAADWPRLVRADYRELPFPDASFDAVLCLFTSLGYLDQAGDVGVLSEFRRVLRPGGALIVETMHRDRLARVFQPRSWETHPDGGLILRERKFDSVAGTLSNHQLYIPDEGERVSRQFVVYVYTVTEWVAMVREAGFDEVEPLGGWRGGSPSSDARLVLRAR